MSFNGTVQIFQPFDPTNVRRLWWVNKFFIARIICFVYHASLFVALAGLDWSSISVTYFIG